MVSINFLQFVKTDNLFSICFLCQRKNILNNTITSKKMSPFETFHEKLYVIILQTYTGYLFPLHLCTVVFSTFCAGEDKEWNRWI